MKKFKLDEILCAVLFSIMCLISFINILSRYLFHFSFSFTEEICINLFFYITILGAGIAFEKKAHPGFDTIYNLFSDKIKKYLNFIILLSSIMIFLIIDYFFIKIINDEINIFHTTSSALNIKMWYYYLIGVLLSIFPVIRIFNCLKTKK